VQLVKFGIQNYRSIRKTPKLAIDTGLTVLLGPNNEGKSNVLRGLTTALELLSFFRYETSLKTKKPTKGKPKSVLPHRRFGGDVYVWERDFPVSMQESKPDGESIFTIDFSLTDAEVVAFKDHVGSQLNSTLPVEIRASKHEASFRVLKPGKAAKPLANKASKIAAFVSNRVQFQHIEAVRSARQAKEVVSRLVAEQLRVLEDNEQYRDALLTIETLQEPILSSISKAITESLSAFLPDVQSVEVSIPSRRRSRALTRETEIMVDDGTATSLDRKGDGVQSLAAISLLRHRASEVSGNQDLIIAIEEPESHLHPKAMHGLKSVLQEIASEHQLVISTHSPLFVERSRISANILVQKQEAKLAKNIAEIRDSLGVRLQDNLQSCEVVLVVEGEEDRVALEPMLSSASNGLRKAFASNRLGIDTLGGGTNLTYKLSQLRLAVCEVHVLLDDDDTGRSSLQKAIDSGLVTIARATLTKCQGMNNTELEDWFKRNNGRTDLRRSFPTWANHGTSSSKPKSKAKSRIWLPKKELTRFSLPESPFSIRWSVRLNHCLVSHDY